MKKKMFIIFLSAIFMLTFLFSSPLIYSFGSESEIFDDKMELLLNDESATQITQQDTELTLTFRYQPLDVYTEEALPVQEKVDEQLQLVLPSGFSYEQDKNVSFTSAISQQEQTLFVDLSQVNGELKLILTIDSTELASDSTIYGNLYINHSKVGQASASVTYRVEEERTNTFSQVSPAIETQEVTPLAEGNLALGIPTQRTLPIAPVSQDQFENVSYFDVGSRAEWDAALTTANNNAREITYINITQNFQMSAVTTVAGVFQSAVTNRTDKKLVVEGNGHTIDFRDLTMGFTNANWDIVFQNMTVYNGNDWGIADSYNIVGNPIITAHNYVQYGAQAFEGSHGKIILSGNTSLTSTNTETYISPIDQQVVTVDQRFAGGNGSSNVEMGEVYIKADSTIAMDNGRYGSNFSIASGGNFYIEDGEQTQVTLSNLKQPIRTGGWGGAQDYSPASISVVSGIVAQPWPQNYRPASLQGRSNSIYFGDNATVTIENGAARQDHAGVMQLMLPNSSIELGTNAKFEGYIAQDLPIGGLHTTPVYFLYGGSIILGDNATFDLTVGQLPENIGTEQFGTVNGEALYFGGIGSLQIGNEANFILKSASSVANGLIKFPVAGSSIQLSNQATLDVGFLQPSANPLISMYGNINVPQSGDYFHQISTWQENQFGDTPNEIFRPINQTVLTYAGTVVTRRQTQLATGFNDNGIVARFASDYTSNAQRLLIEPLVQGVQSTEPITNETQTEYTVSGSAEPPGEYVELSGGPFDNSSLTTEQKRAVIQDDGTFQWQGALPRPFYYGDTIRVSYVIDPSIFVETAVEDVTSPSGTGRTIHIAENTIIPEAGNFIETVEDTNPTQTDKTAFNYRFVNDTIAAGNPATRTTNQETQTYNDQVIIDDTRGNDSSPVDVSLIVHDAATINTIQANNLTLYYSDVASFEQGASDYETYLLNAINTKAQTIIDGEIVDLTSEITIGNLASIPSTVGGPYPIDLIVAATPENQLSQDIRKTINFSVLSNLVNPRDPSADNVSDAENIGTGENADLRLDYVPSNFDFGNGNVQWTDRTYSAQGTNDQWVQVTDNRTDESGWELKVSATPFVSNTDELLGANLIIPQGEIYNRNSGGNADPAGLISQGTVALTTNPTTLLSGDGENSKNESTYVWKKNQVQLFVPRGQGRAGETYQSTITWIVEAGADS